MWLTDWSRPGGELRRLGLKLMTPCCAGDTLVLTGTVREKRAAGGEALVEVAFTMAVAERTHCRGEAAIALPLAQDACSPPLPREGRARGAVPPRRPPV